MTTKDVVTAIVYPKYVMFRRRPANTLLMKSKTTWNMEVKYDHYVIMILSASSPFLAPD